MTDRAMLELAAKAADVDAKWSDFHHQLLLKDPQRGGLRIWNPLTDDGDALRLAVKLGIYIGKTADSVKRFAQLEPMEDAFYETGDPYAATRRAIVRAAAEIGRMM